jgi:phosphate:Na+ symporter
LKEPPEEEAERLHMTSTLHALDHASRLVEILVDGGLPGKPAGAPNDFRAAELCMQAMRAVQAVGGSITAESALSARAAPIGWSVSSEVAAALAEAEAAARELDALQRSYRAATLASVAPGKLTAADAFARIDAARRLDRIAHHAWRSAAHLLGRGAHDNPGTGP